MKFIHYIILFSVSCFFDCKKSPQHDSVPTTIRGINFDLLLKTIDIYTNGESITTYAYNNYKQLIQENSTRDFTDGTKWKVINNWYRNSQGLLDSMKSEYTYGVDPTGLQKLYYHYDASAKLSYNILFRNFNNPSGSIDSCVYTYSGSLVIKRMDYTSAVSTILNHTLTHEIYYQYDTSNNITAITFVNYDFSGGTPAHKDTVILSYAYDNKKNPYQNDAFYEYFVNFSFDNYVSKNNIVQILYSGSSTSNYKDEFTFQYNLASKPDRVLVRSFGKGTTGPITWTTDYYYD
jgi:hypothetical protein